MIHLRKEHVCTLTRNFEEHSTHPALEKIRLFGKCINLETHEVFYKGKRYQLEPRLVKLLEILWSEKGKVVLKQDLKDALWGKTIVTEDSLTKAVSRLRKTLDIGLTKSAIVTINGKGYMLRSTTLLPSLRRHWQVLALSSVVLFLLYVLLGSGLVQWVIHMRQGIV